MTEDRNMTVQPVNMTHSPVPTVHAQPGPRAPVHSASNTDPRSRKPTAMNIHAIISSVVPTIAVLRAVPIHDDRPHAAPSSVMAVIT